MSTLADAALTADERALLERFARELEQRLGDALHAVWLFGARARGDTPLGEDSDVDVLVLVDDASWEGKRVVREALDAAARELGLAAVAWSFSVHVNTPEWLAERRALRSFFVAEVDRDKLVVPVADEPSLSRVPCGGAAASGCRVGGGGEGTGDSLEHGLLRDAVRGAGRAERARDVCEDPPRLVR
ncbi:MAG: nucleotidyltransferase domain-containing protein [Thermoleophilaceae bacterium]|nr:nucleotidyltransferase domain-containing protein [Thermoleophilaceae bacterium]